MRSSRCIRRKTTELFCRQTARLLGLALLGFSGIAAAGPVDWFRDLFREPKSVPVKISSVNEAPIALRPGKALQLRLDSLAPEFEFADGASRYRRITLTRPLDKAVIRFRVLTQHHEASPRFTALAPELHILNDSGLIRESMPVRPLKLNIAPFRPAELRGCLQVDHLRSFLLAADTDQVDRRYRYNARTRSASYPQRGFYRSDAPINVSLTYAGVGELVLRVLPASKAAALCGPHG